MKHYQYYIEMMYRKFKDGKINNQQCWRYMAKIAEWEYHHTTIKNSIWNYFTTKQ